MSELPTPEAEAPAQPVPFIGTREVRKRVLGLAGPVIGENFLETLLGIVDTMLVAGLGAVAIAGVGSALQVMFFMISALSALAIGSALKHPRHNLGRLAGKMPVGASRMLALPNPIRKDNSNASRDE